MQSSIGDVPNVTMHKTFVTAHFETPLYRKLVIWQITMRFDNP